MGGVDEEVEGGVGGRGLAAEAGLGPELLPLFGAVTGVHLEASGVDGGEEPVAKVALEGSGELELLDFAGQGSGQPADDEGSVVGGFPAGAMRILGRLQTWPGGGADLRWG